MERLVERALIGWQTFSASFMGDPVARASNRYVLHITMETHEATSRGPDRFPPTFPYYASTRARDGGRFQCAAILRNKPHRIAPHFAVVGDDVIEHHAARDITVAVAVPARRGAHCVHVSVRVNAWSRA